MKYRNGFISNSSSSSFCIIGTEHVSEIAKLVTAEEKDFGGYDYQHRWMQGTDYFGYGMHEGDVVTFYGDYQPEYVGVDAVLLLEQFNLPQACEAFVKLCKEKLGVDIDLKRVGPHYGEAGN